MVVEGIIRCDLCGDVAKKYEYVAITFDGRVAHFHSRRPSDCIIKHIELIQIITAAP